MGKWSSGTGKKDPNIMDLQTISPFTLHTLYTTGTRKGIETVTFSERWNRTSR